MRPCAVGAITRAAGGITTDTVLGRRAVPDRFRDGGNALVVYADHPGRLSEYAVHALLFLGRRRVKANALVITLGGIRDPVRVTSNRAVSSRLRVRVEGIRDAALVAVPRLLGSCPVLVE